jgi:hypothetical protein
MDAEEIAINVSVIQIDSARRMVINKEDQIAMGTTDVTRESSKLHGREMRVLLNRPLRTLI